MPVVDAVPQPGGFPAEVLEHDQAEVDQALEVRLHGAGLGGRLDIGNTGSVARTDSLETGAGVPMELLKYLRELVHGRASFGLNMAERF